MNRTPIEWCRTYAADGSFEEGYSVNPIRFLPHGATRTTTMCQKVSPGCAHCYAEGITRRFWPKSGLVRIDELGQPWANEEFPGYTALGVSPEVGKFVLDEKTLLSVLKHKKPARIFWGDMTDLFQASVPDEMLDKCFAVAALTPHLTHMFLTKRPERMLAYMTGAAGRLADVIEGMRTDQPRRAVGPLPHLNGGETWFPLANVWLGTSVENQEQANKRIPFLVRTPAAVRFISAEPLLGPVDLRRVDLYQHVIPQLMTALEASGQPVGNEDNYPQHIWLDSLTGDNPGDDPIPPLDWVIVGGESGPRARPMHPDWARELRGQCTAEDVPFFFKQWGEWTPGENVEASEGSVQTAHWFDSRWSFNSEDLANDEGHRDDEPDLYRVGKKAAGNLLDGVAWNQFPEANLG